MKSIIQCCVCAVDAPFEAGLFWTRTAEPIPWNWSHADCAPSSDGTYRIPGPQIDTPEKATEWRKKLLEEPWLRLGALDRGLQQLHPSLCGGCC